MYIFDSVINEQLELILTLEMTHLFMYNGYILILFKI
jgi:hypothetical protein